MSDPDDRDGGWLDDLLDDDNDNDDDDSGYDPDLDDPYDVPDRDEPERGPADPTRPDSPRIDPR